MMETKNRENYDEMFWVYKPKIQFLFKEYFYADDRETSFEKFIACQLCGRKIARK